MGNFAGFKRGTFAVRSRLRRFVSASIPGLIAILVVVGGLESALAQGTSQSQDYVPGEVIVKLKRKSAKSMESQAFIGKAVSEKAMSLKGSWGGLNMHHFALKPGQNVEDVIKDLKGDPEVLYVEPNYIVHRQSSGFEGQPVALNDVRELATNDITAFAQTNSPIQLQDAWSVSSSSANTPVVAVIDTGLDLQHDVFLQTGAIWQNPNEIANNGIDDDKNGYVDDMVGWNFVAASNNPQDDDGHGTHVSGIVLGATQNISAAVLQPAKIRIMTLKFLDAKGSGTTADAIKAIYYAVNNGAKVLNNSWGGGGFSNSLLEALAYAYDKRVVIAAAAGNAANNNDAQPTYPANYSVPSLISVAATSDLDGLASFSNFGAQTVHMGSPGVSIWSTYPGNMFGRSSGTSMATPFVAGIAALIAREVPEITGFQVKQILFGAAVPINSLSTKTVTRARLNAFNAVQAAKGTPLVPDQPAFVSSGGRAPDSVEAAAPAGCGLVAKSMYDSSGGGPSGPFRNLAFFGLLLVLVSPILVSMALRSRDGRGRRRHTRYHIDSAVTLKLGDRELTGTVSTISMGGVQLNTDAWLEQGGVVKMSICSPDGKDAIDVEGKIVWSEEKKRYGVAFSNPDSSIRRAISAWSKSLLQA